MYPDDMEREMFEKALETEALIDACNPPLSPMDACVVRAHRAAVDCLRELFSEKLDAHVSAQVNVIMEESVAELLRRGQENSIQRQRLGV